MNHEEMLKNLQERFDFSEVKAKVIFFTLEQYFSKEQNHQSDLTESEDN